MSSFKGFSEEDIKKLAANTTHNKQKTLSGETFNNNRVILKINKGHKNAVIKSLISGNELHTNEKTNDIPVEARLTISKTKLTEDNKKIKSETNKNHTESNLEEHFEGGIDSVPKENAVKEPKMQSVDTSEPVSVCNERENVENGLSEKQETPNENRTDINSKLESDSDDRNVPDTRVRETLRQRSVDLERLQTRQKLIEEQNRRRKEMVSKLLADRTKRTREEAQKLNEIQTEFKKLDAILSEDVNILRKQIEVASIEYMEAQKKYYKIEKEFLDAKLTLHQKLERKELLTEHLCTIIEKNEERKAQKLSELLDKLNASANESQIQDNPQGNENEKAESIIACHKESKE